MEKWRGTNPAEPPRRSTSHVPGGGTQQQLLLTLELLTGEDAAVADIYELCQFVCDERASSIGLPSPYCEIRQWIMVCRVTAWLGNVAVTHCLRSRLLVTLLMSRDLFGLDSDPVATRSRCGRVGDVLNSIFRSLRLSPDR